MNCPHCIRPLILGIALIENQALEPFCPLCGYRPPPPPLVCGRRHCNRETRPPYRTCHHHRTIGRSNIQERRRRLKAAKSCVDCGRRPAAARHIRCMDCKAESDAAVKAHKERYNAAGRCPHCKAHKALNGYSKCLTCRQVESDRQKAARRPKYLTPKEVMDIRAAAAGGETVAAISREYDRNYFTIYRIVTGQRYTGKDGAIKERRRRQE